MNLTHRQFEILVAAAEAESFSAAAQRLGISQPSLSESIRRIEVEIGTRLFERTTRSIKLTAEGRHVADVARDIVRDFKHGLARLASRGNNRQGRIRIAALPSIAVAVLPAVIEVFRRVHPGIDIDLHDVLHERALVLLIEGTADIAVTLKPATHDDLVFAEIGSDVAHLVCRTTTR
jgi:LysR family transcriptional regulator, carnitine catabolism transcriptional activator